MAIKAHNLINAPASTALSSSILSTDTSLVVSTVFTISPPFKATFTTTGEIIEVGTVSGTTWSNITRGAESTTAAAHSSGDRLALLITAGHLTERRPFNVYPSTVATENTLNIRSAIADGYANLAPGTYHVAQTASETELFLITKAIEFDGNGSTIIVDNTSSSLDAIHIVPQSRVAGLHFHDFTLQPNTYNTMRYGLHFDCPATPAVGFLTNVRVNDIYIGDFGTAGVRVSNPTSTDGFFCSQFRDMFACSFSLERIGDSVIFSGVEAATDTNKIGFDITNVPGATCIKLQDCNCVNGGGAVRAQMNGSWLVIENCQFEHTSQTYSPPSGAVTYISGAELVTIMNSNSCDYGMVSNANGLHLYNCNYVTAIGNHTGGNGTGYDLYIQGGANNYAPQTSNMLIHSSYSNTGTNRTSI